MKNEKPVLALGLWNMGDGRFHRLMTPDEAKKTIRHALDKGITTFDTAVSYGNADTFLAAVAKERRLDRGSYRVWSKVMPVPSMERRLEGELRNLRSEYVDVLMLHWPTDGEGLFSSLRTLEKLKETGKALETGVGNFPLNMLQAVAKDFPISYHERPLSPIWTKDWNEESKLDIRTIAYAPGAFGVLGEKYSDARPDDMRKDLYVWDREEFLELRKTISEIAAARGTSAHRVSVDFTSSLAPYAMALGAGKPEDLDERETELTREEFQSILEAARKLSGSYAGDNVFGHNWH